MTYQWHCLLCKHYKGAHTLYIHDENNKTESSLLSIYLFIIVVLMPTTYDTNR